MWRARAWSEGARGEGCAACEGPREEVARAALHARGARAMTGAWGEGARVAGAREGWRGLQGRGARAHAWQAALHARGRARGWRGLRFMRGGRGPWRGRGARARVAGAALHARGRARGWRGLRCMRGGRGQWRGRGARMHARKEHTHLQTQHRAHHLLLLPLRHRFDEGSDGDASFGDKFCVLFVHGVSRIFHARTFRQKKHGLLANMKRLYQRSF